MDQGGYDFADTEADEDSGIEEETAAIKSKVPRKRKADAETVHKLEEDPNVYHWERDDGLHSGNSLGMIMVFLSIAPIYGALCKRKTPAADTLFGVEHGC